MGDRMEASVNDINLDVWSKNLQEGSVYLFKNIEINEAKMWHVIVDHPFRMSINTTSIVQQMDDDGSIPIKKYNIMSLKDLHVVKPKGQSLIDVLGIVINMIPITTVIKKDGKEEKKSNIDIIDQSGVISRITVWDDLAIKYDDELQNIYQGSYCLSTTRMSIFEFNPSDIKGIDDLQNWYSMEGAFQIKEHRVASSFLTQHMFNMVEELQISQLINSCISYPTETRIYQTKAVISGIFTDTRLWYDCCKQCLSTYQIAIGRNCCNNCLTENPSCISRMKIKIGIFDTSGEIYVTTFGEVAEKILGLTIQLLLDLLSKDNASLELEKLVNARLCKKYIFHLKLTKKNDHFALQKNFTTTFVEEVVDQQNINEGDDN